MNIKTKIKLFFKSFFTRVNLSKIAVIFLFGLICRVFISHFFSEVNLLLDHFNPISLAYYSIFASFIVFINEFFTTFNISIFPNFKELWSNIPSFTRLWSSLKFFKFEYFKLSSIRYYSRSLYSRLFSYDIIEGKQLNDVKDVLEDSLVNKKNSDVEGKGKGKGISSQQGESSRGNTQRGESSRGNTQQGESSRGNKGKAPVYGTGWLDKSECNEGKSSYKPYTPNAFKGYADVATSTTGLSTTNLPISQELDSTPRYELPVPISNTIHELDSNPIYEIKGNEIKYYTNRTTPPPFVDINTKPRLPLSNVEGDNSGNSTPISVNTNYTYDSNGTNHATIDYPLTSTPISGTPRSGNQLVSINSESIFSSQEFAISRQDISGDLNLGIERLNSSNSITKVYLKYKNISKRKFYWHIWERNRDSFESYADFKKAFDPKTPIMKSIYREVKSDISDEIRKLVDNDRPFERSTINQRRQGNIVYPPRR